MHKKIKLFLMNIHDKVIISKTRFCPPHYIPHKMPWGPKVVDEHCHYHHAKWRMIHHKLFCTFVKCKNYKFMMKKYNEYLEKKSK